MEVAEQVVDNALVAAGLVDDPRMMLPRLNALLERVVGVVGGTPYPGAQALESRCTSLAVQLVRAQSIAKF
jgi:hypothetical protein